jgi:hypothetical protein
MQESVKMSGKSAIVRYVRKNIDNSKGEKMTTISDIQKFSVCVDCYLTAAGYTPEELGHTPENEPLNKMDYQVIVPDSEGDPHFSNYPCPGCNSHLAGNRMEVSVWDHNKK